ncbi:hypothetical protein AAFF_G00340990 [Aldrovandia affinis]|uniref:Rho GTPase activating protein 27 n=1 Tax=Aldrovandia affinis TaxID=143900 RepID=A0AAD7SKK5_9TELE|nr:hypothetical protein AAFF_G00340990 [Aldrovandia affinis]
MTTAASGKDLVLVEFEYEYTGRDGGLVAIKPNERYVLLAKTNDHWWHVRKDERAKPFYIPAKYVKELPRDLPSPLDFVRPAEPASAEPPVGKRLADAAEERPGEVTIRVRSPNSYKKAENRMSTFGVPLDIHDPVLKRGGLPEPAVALQLPPPPPHSTEGPKEGSQHPGKRFTLVPAGSLSLQKCRVPSFSPADPVIRSAQAKPVEPPVVKDVEVREPSDPPKPPAEFEDPPGLDSDLSQDSENIYESISDIQGLRLQDSPVTDPARPLSQAMSPTPVPVPTLAPRPPPPPPSQTKNDSPSTAVYVNISELRKSAPRSAPTSSSSPDAPRPLSLDSEGWEVHTDQDSGQEYYYHPATGHTTWDNPLSPLMDPESPLVPLSSPSTSPSPSPPTAAGSDWEKLLDEASGRPYFYNHVSRETSWVPPELGSPSSEVTEPVSLPQLQEDGPPPLPDEDYPMDDDEERKPPPTYPKDHALAQLKRSAVPQFILDVAPPAGWARSVDPEGKIVFTSEHTQEQWIKSVDDRGQTYYYLRDGSRSLWKLPELPVTSGQPKVGNGVDPEGVSVLKNWRHTMSPTLFSPSKDDVKFFPAHRRNISDYTSDASSSGNSPELPHHADRFKLQRNPSNQSSDFQHQHTQTLEKAGILNRTKVAENGKRLRKNWAQSWTVLHGGILTFHKDPKSTPAGTANKTNQIVPEFTVELRGATVHWASKDKSSKKNVLELRTRHGSEYLVQYDTESIITDWHKVIVDTIRQLDMDHHSEEEEEDEEKSPGPTDRDDKKRVSTRHSSSAHSADSEQGKVRTKLRKFLQRRPTLQSVKERGYIRDSVFGCHLDTLCKRENSTVPCFIEKCIKSVERRGLNIDGIYRVSGNLAVIQKLRHRADHEENLDLEDGQWEEIHVITGALKLFLRELPEPLFPYSYFDSFIAAIKLPDYNQRVSYMEDLVKSLPLPNLNTMKVLFKHLRTVIEFGEVNRMSVQSVAIVFGPTLLRPETESANITMHMVFQSQIVELILNEYERLFRPD